MDLELTKKIANEIKEQTKTQAYSIKIDHERKPNIFDSKFGGLPYWNFTKEYPESAEGEKLLLLAQINLDKLNDATGCLPSSGMLQFFAGCVGNDMFGLDFDNADVQDTWRVVWHKQIDYSLSAEDIAVHNIPTNLDEGNDEYSPVLGEYAVNIESCEISMGLEDYRSHDLFNHIKEKFGAKDYDSLFDLSDDYDELDRIFDDNTGHWLLGYPFFTQDDPREYDELRQYDTLLFQMDSDGSSDEYYTIWGDVGVGNFFINSEDLKNRDFSKVLYNWDCC